MLLNRDVAGMERPPLQVDHQASNDVHEEDDQERECADGNPEQEGPQGVHEHQAKDRHRHNGYNDSATRNAVSAQDFHMWWFAHAQMRSSCLVGIRFLIDMRYIMSSAAIACCSAAAPYRRPRLLSLPTPE